MGSLNNDCLSPQEEIAVKQEMLELLEEKARRHHEQAEREAWLAERHRCRIPDDVLHHKVVNAGQLVAVDGWHIRAR